MQKVTSPSVENLPKIGYLVNNEEKKEKFYKNESHIPQQTLLTGIKADAHKLYNDVFTYFPKGFAGSKNSDFYEYLSLGMVPNLIGSAMLIALYGLANGKYSKIDAKFADFGAKQVGAGVVLYAAGKWAYQRLARAGIKASTGVDLEMRYTKKVNELPEVGQEKGLVRTQYPGVYDSVQFYRSDLLTKDAELNHGNAYYHDDKITQKAGFKNKLHAPNQTASDKIRKVKARTTALENIGKYIVAGTGVAYGFQKAFGDINFKNPSTFVRSTAKALKDGAVQLWKGAEKFDSTKSLGKVLNFGSKHLGKAMIIASGAATLLTWLIPTIGFKHNSNTIKTKVDTNKEYEVC